ncbi:hypothetical protein C0J52_21702 [Blattella germanica]|nr:hypothetical protein C0J52_21702 [Blattella germanica]
MHQCITKLLVNSTWIILQSSNISVRDVSSASSFMCFLIKSVEGISSDVTVVFTVSILSDIATNSVLLNSVEACVEGIGTGAEGFFTSCMVVGSFDSSTIFFLRPGAMKKTCNLLT